MEGQNPFLNWCKLIAANLEGTLRHALLLVILNNQSHYYSGNFAKTTCRAVRRCFQTQRKRVQQKFNSNTIRKTWTERKWLSTKYERKKRQLLWMMPITLLWPYCLRLRHCPIYIRKLLYKYGVIVRLLICKLEFHWVSKYTQAFYNELDFCHLIFWSLMNQSLDVLRFRNVVWHQFMLW